MAAIDDLTYVTLVKDAETPADLARWDGVRVGVPAGTPLPTDGTGVLYGVPGYARQTAAGWEWVIGTAQDELLRAVNRIPGAGGWADPEARRVWRTAARQMRAAGVSGPELAPMLTAMYAAAVANQAATPG